MNLFIYVKILFVSECSCNPILLLRLHLLCAKYYLEEYTVRSIKKLNALALSFSSIIFNKSIITCAFILNIYVIANGFSYSIILNVLLVEFS